MNTTPVQLALRAPPMIENPKPVGRRVPLPPQQHTYDQAKRGTRLEADCKIIQVYNLTTTEARVSGDVEARCGARIETLKGSLVTIIPIL